MRSVDEWLYVQSGSDSHAVCDGHCHMPRHRICHIYSQLAKMAERFGARVGDGIGVNCVFSYYILVDFTPIYFGSACDAPVIYMEGVQFYGGFLQSGSLRSVSCSL